MKSSLTGFFSVLFVTIGASIPSQSGAADPYWDGTYTAANADGGAGSRTTGGTHWDGAAMQGNATPWANHDVAIFGGMRGAVTPGGAITANGLTFDSSGYTISGASRKSSSWPEIPEFACQPGN